MKYDLKRKIYVLEHSFPELEQLQTIESEHQIVESLGCPIILNRYQSNDAFCTLYEHVVLVAALCWDNKNYYGDKLQHTKVQFKVDVDSDITYELPLNRFMRSLVYIKPLISYIDEIDITRFLVYDVLNDKRRKELLNNVVSDLYKFGYTIDEVKSIIADLSLDIKTLLLIFSHADMHIYTAENLFIDHYMESELIREINNTEYPPDMQIVDIISENARLYKLFDDEMTKRGCPFFIDNKYTKILKPKQIEECYINFSVIPDGVNDAIVPITMNGNGFKAGYNDLSVFYAGSIAARVPDIMNEEYMGTVGYFGRNLWILTAGTLSPTVSDCGSQNPIPITVDECVLRMMNGRYYYRDKNRTVLRMLKQTDKHLIGETLYFRSPATCNLTEDCCHICYGSQAIHVGDLPNGFIYTTETMTKDINQKVLSAKHLLRADAEKIEYNSAFEKYFDIVSSNIIPKDEDKRFDIFIPEDYQNNTADNLTFYVGKDMTPIIISHYANIYIPDNVIDKCKLVTVDDVNYYKISSRKLFDLDGVLCIVTPINIMMTAKYMDMMRLFESNVTKYEKIEDAVVYLMGLLDGLIPIYSTHGEIMLGKLLRRVDNELLRPDWKVPDQKYQILRVKTALANIEGISAGLASEQTAHHLKHSIFDKRNAIKRVGPSSFIDFLFGEETM